MKDALAGRVLMMRLRKKAGALHVLGEVVIRSDPPEPERADVYYRLALAEELGMRSLPPTASGAWGGATSEQGRLRKCNGGSPQQGKRTAS